VPLAASQITKELAPYPRADGRWCCRSHRDDVFPVTNKQANDDKQNNQKVRPDGQIKDSSRCAPRTFDAHLEVYFSN
jgi:hypothetical protein